MTGVVRVCPKCRQKNRVRAANLANRVRCGSCKTELGSLAEPVDADVELFDAVIRDAKVPVLVDFWATWCAPCRMAAPEVKQVAHEVAGRAIVLKVDTDRYGELGTRYGVRGIPNFVVLKNGRVLLQRAGVVPHDEMRRWLESAEAASTV